MIHILVPEYHFKIFFSSTIKFTGINDRWYQNARKFILDILIGIVVPNYINNLVCASEAVCSRYTFSLALLLQLVMTYY